MTGFNITEYVKTVNGVEVERRQLTTCAECGAELKSAEEWSHHKKIHTRITEFDRGCWQPRKNRK